MPVATDNAKRRGPGTGFQYVPTDRPVERCPIGHEFLGRGFLLAVGRPKYVNHLHKAVKALGGSLVVQWEEGMISRRRMEDAIDALIDLLAISVVTLIWNVNRTRNSTI